MKYKLAVVDDDQVILDMIVDSLESAGYMVQTATDGKEAVKLVTDAKPDLIILDWNLPTMNGIQICQFIRSHPKTAKIPILMLTVLDQMSQKISAFETGADDYLTKPFKIEELLIRVKALLRRSKDSDSGSSDIVEIGPIQMNTTSHKVFVGGKEIILRPKEFELLSVLMKSPERVLTRKQLIEKVWGYDTDLVTTRTIDAHLARLRTKLGPKASKMIQTILGFGYIMKE